MLFGLLDLKRLYSCIKELIFVRNWSVFLWTDWPDSYHPLILFFTFHLFSFKHAFIIFVARFPGKVRAKVLLSHQNRSLRNGVHICHKGSKQGFEKGIWDVEGITQLVPNSSFTTWVSLFNLNDSMAVPRNVWKEEESAHFSTFCYFLHLLVITSMFHGVGSGSTHPVGSLMSGSQPSVVAFPAHGAFVPPPPTSSPHPSLSGWGPIELNYFWKSSTLWLLSVFVAF